MKFTYDISGFDRINDRMNRIRSRLKGGEMYEAMSDVLQESITANFNSGGRPSWPARKYSYPHPILDKSGTMRDAAESSAEGTQWAHSGKQHLLDVVTPEYGQFHQYGTRYLPERKFVQPLPGEVEEMRRIIREAIAEL